MIRFSKVADCWNPQIKTFSDFFLSFSNTYCSLNTLTHSAWEYFEILALQKKSKTPNFKRFYLKN